MLLFLKMAQETGTEHRIPAGNRWADLKALTGLNQHNHFRQMLVNLVRAPDPLVSSSGAPTNSFAWPAPWKPDLLSLSAQGPI